MRNSDNFWPALMYKLCSFNSLRSEYQCSHFCIKLSLCLCNFDLWIWPFERRVNMGGIGALTWKEMGIMLEQEDLSACWDPTHASTIEIRWRADFLLLAWHTHAGGCWISASLGFSSPAWVNSQCLMLLAKQTVLSPCSPPPSLTYTSNTKEPASLCQETLTQAPYPLLITYSFTKSNAIMRLLSENEICSQCGSSLMEMIKWEMIWIYE